MASEATGAAGIAERYAAALYDLGEQAKALDAVAQDLRDLQAMVDESPDFRRLIRSPLMNRDEQWSAMDALLRQAGMHELSRKFLGVVTENRRLFALPAMAKAYLRLLAARRGEITADVTTATKLSDAQMTSLTESLKKAVGAKVAVEHKVDPEILGGLVVRVGSRMFDSSLRTKLQKMQLAMKGTG